MEEVEYNVDVRPVTDEKTGEIVLHDMFVNGQWLGSRRTVEQCQARLQFLGFLQKTA